MDGDAQLKADVIRLVRDMKGDQYLHNRVTGELFQLQNVAGGLWELEFGMHDNPFVFIGNTNEGHFAVDLM